MEPSNWPQERKALRADTAFTCSTVDGLPDLYRRKCETKGCDGDGPTVMEPTRKNGRTVVRPCPTCGATVRPDTDAETRVVRWILDAPDPDRVASRQDQDHQRENGPTKRGGPALFTPAKAPEIPLDAGPGKPHKVAMFEQDPAGRWPEAVRERWDDLDDATRERIEAARDRIGRLRALAKAPDPPNGWPAPGEPDDAETTAAAEAAEREGVYPGRRFDTAGAADVDEPTVAHVLEADPRPAPSTDWEGEWRTDPPALARAILHQHAGRILAVHPDADGTGGRGSTENNENTAYVLHDSGVWDPRSAPWCEWTRAVIERYQAEATAAADAADGAERKKALRTVARGLARAHAQAETLAQQVRRTVFQAARPLEGGPLDFPDLTECEAADLDRDTSMLGTLSGVVDLNTGKLLPPDVGRVKLVSLWTPVRFDPDADQAEIDRLFEHQPDAGRDLLDAVGHAMHGQPSRRFYSLVGEKGGGKTVVLRAVGLALGPHYCSTPPANAMAPSKGESGAHTAGLELHVPPYRLALYDDIELDRANSIRLKQISGDSAIGYRRLRENPRMAKASATVLFAANPEEVPTFGLEDQALADRHRELEWEPVPAADVDRALKGRWEQDDALREAMLARLVQHAARATPGRPPESERMTTAAARRLAKDVGELAHLAAMLERERGAFLPSADVWAEWCRLHDVAPVMDALKNETWPTRGRIGGKTRKRMFQDLARLVRLPDSKKERPEGGGDPVRGYPGWRFRTSD